MVSAIKGETYCCEGCNRIYFTRVVAEECEKSHESKDAVQEKAE